VRYEKVKDWVRRDVRKKEKQRAACVTSFSFFFSVFLFKKENIYIYGWASPGRCPGKPGGILALGHK
jgi:hypothetical protein